jgi:hypothetical protein
MSDQSQETNEPAETGDLQRILELATASTAAPGHGMDPQTAALREAWTAWGRLLETAETPLDPSTIRRRKARSAARRRLPVGVGLAAAVVLVAAAGAWFGLASRRAGAPLPQPEVAEVGALPSEPPQLPQTAGETPSPQAVADFANDLRQSPSVASEAAWDDTVDDEIVQVGEQLMGLQKNWRACADALDPVWCRLGQIEAEVENGTL